MSERVLIWVYGINGERVNAIVAPDLEIDERLFRSYTIKFSLPLEDQKAMHLVQDVLLVVDGERFFITKIKKSREGPETDVTVIAESTWMRLVENKLAGSFVLEQVTAEQGLTAALSGTGWSIDFVTLDPTLRSFEATDATVLDVLWQWAKVCGCELSFDNRGSRVVMTPKVGATLGLGFRYGRNLTQITRDEEGPRVTRLYCYGRNDLSIEALTGGAPYIEDFSYYTDQGLTIEFARQWYTKDDVYRDDSFLEDAPLYDAALARLTTLSRPQVSYSLSVVDLSAMTGLDEGNYRIGDTVYVADEVLGIDIQARVSRTVRHPAEPSEDSIELTAGDVLLPDPSVGNSRANTTASWEMFESRNWVGERRIGSFDTILNRIGLRTVAEAEWIVGYKITGIGTGDGTITFTPVDDITGAVMWPERSFTVSAGVPFDWDFTFGKKDIEPGGHSLVVRASGSGAGLIIAPYETALWVLAKGTTRQNVVLPNSIRFDYTGAVQTWQVPDDVFEAMIESHGGGSSGASGGKVTAKLPVAGGQVFDVYVGGGNPWTATAGAWPNGGASVSGGGSSRGNGGGGSSDVRPSGAGPEDTLIMAAGAGGARRTGLEADPEGGVGGNGGFYVGYDGGLSGSTAGTGATQMTGGDLDGSFWQGGDISGSTGPLSYPGGGGGGGWYGGGASGNNFSIGSGGGGGSGWVRADAYDLETEDGENSGDGYVIISWENPE